MSALTASGQNYDCKKKFDASLLHHCIVWQPAGMAHPLNVVQDSMGPAPAQGPHWTLCYNALD